MGKLLDSTDSPAEPSEHAVTWTPENPGDALVGCLEHVGVVQTDWGKSDIAYIRARCGVLRAVYLTCSVLIQRWNEVQPQIGERIAITYDGEREGGEHPFKSFLLDVERSPADRTSTGEAASVREAEYELSPGEGMPF